MRDCEAYMEQISALLDGELGEYDTDVLMAHLDTCPGCRMFYDAFLSISESVASFSVKAPAGLAGDIMYAIENTADTARAGRRRFRVGRYAAMAACLALMVLTATYFMRQNPSGGNASMTVRRAGTGAMDVAPMAAPPPQEEPHPDSFLFVQPEGGDAGSNNGAAEKSQEFDAARDEENVCIFGGEVRPIDAPEAREFVDSLAELQSAKVYLPEDPERPIFSIEDAETMAALQDFFEWAEKPEGFNTASEPAVLIEAVPKEGEPYTIRLWVFEGKLYCGIAGDATRLYVAKGSIDDLLVFLTEHVS